MGLCGGPSSSSRLTPRPLSGLEPALSCPPGLRKVCPRLLLPPFGFPLQLSPGHTPCAFAVPVDY